MNNETLDRGEPADPIEAIQAETDELQADLRRMEDAAEERRIHQERRMAELRAETAAAEAKAAQIEFRLRCGQAAQCGIDFEALSPSDQSRFGKLFDEYLARDGDDPVAAGFLSAVDEALRLKAEAIEAGKTQEGARETFRGHIAANAPCDYNEFKNRSRASILTFAKAHFPHGRTTASIRRHGREARTSTSVRTRGSRRTASTTSGGGRSDDPDPSDQADPERRVIDGGSTTERHEAPEPDDSARPDVTAAPPSPDGNRPAPRTCPACGEAIDPGRRSDAVYCNSTCRMARKKMDADAPPKWTDAQRIAALQKQRAKILRAAPVADLPIATSAEAIGDKQCRAEGRHPDHIAEVSARVRAADSPREAAEILKSWLSRCFHDRRYGDLTCRNCRRTVAERDFRPASFRSTFNGEPEDLWLEMTTDGHGQSLYPSASSGRAFR